MIHTIENDSLRVRISETGAELQGIYGKQQGREYLWQGDKSIWPGRAPLLFPFVGRPRDGGYLHKGEWHTLDKHGFARKSAFAAEQMGEGAIAFTLAQDAGTRADYPFAFRLVVRYTLAGSTLHILHTVQNTGGEALPFAIGAHPGFACAMGDTLVFEREEPLRPYRLTEAGLLQDTPEAACGTGEIAITPQLFDRDALIFKGLASRTVSLCHAGQRFLTVDTGGAPCLGIWAKPAAPYVCIEPWHGVDDSASTPHALTEKPFVQTLPPKGTFTFPISIMIEEAQAHA